MFDGEPADLFSCFYLLYDSEVHAVVIEYVLVGGLNSLPFSLGCKKAVIRGIRCG